MRTIGYFEYDTGYFEPSDFDIQVDEWKNALRESVKQQYKEEMEALKKENEELREIKNEIDKYRRTQEELTNKLNKQIADAKLKARKIRASELLNDFQVDAYIAYGNSEYINDKCDKCDNHRYIHFKSPSGKDMKEECSCAKMKYKYTVQPAKMIKFYTDKNEVTQKSYAMYVETVKEKEGYMGNQGRWEIVLDDEWSNTHYTIYTNQKFNEVASYRTYFLDKEKCQEYCDWLNSKEN